MDKLKQLKNVLRKMKSVVVAFSGGVDSSFLLKSAEDAVSVKNVIAVTAVSDTYTRSELEQAKYFAKALGVRHNLIFTKESEDENFIRNPVDRCYFCKKELFNKLRDFARDNKFDYVVDASNIDDLNDYRPGSIAKKELGVRSPLQEAGMTKNDIRRFSKRLGLNTWDLPQMACLASRIPYGEPIEKNILNKIEKAEAFIKKQGISHVRVRYHKDIARIEVDKIAIKRFLDRRFCDRIIRYVKSLGFSYVVLDLEGYRTGSMNDVGCYVRLHSNG